MRGAVEPYDGWYSAQYEVRNEATTLLYPREGTEAHYATLFTSGLNAAAPASISAVPQPDALSAVVCAAGRSYQIQVQRPAQADETVSVTVSPAPCDG